MIAASAWKSLPALVVTLLALGEVEGGLAGRVAPAPELDVAALLDQYAAGQVEVALGTVSSASLEQATRLRGQWAVRGQRWVNAAPEDRSHRLLVAAVFALEVEVARAERGDWPMFIRTDCAGRCVLEWARSLLQLRGAPDETERTWWLASLALLEGVRDWRFLSTPATTLMPFDLAQGHVIHALERFPGDPSFRLSRAFAVASRFLVVTAGAPRGPLPSSTSAELGRITVIYRGRGGAPVNAPPTGSGPLRQQVSLRERVAQEFAALADDPQVGPEARVRLGYLRWAGGEDDAARTELRAVADAATADADVRYLAHFFLGTMAQASGDAETARKELTAAVAARPDSQSAVMGLAALQFQHGEVDAAYDVMRASMTNRRGDDDPWRQFLYGSFRTLPSLLARLRRAVQR